jgi:fumarate hydratase class II
MGRTTINATVGTYGQQQRRITMPFREEQDSMGKVGVPEEAYYGAQTQRAKNNFLISDLRFPSVFYKALGLIKKHAAIVNLDLGLIEPETAKAIIAASDEMIDGKFNDQFVVDVFQTGSGTSTNMNANEIIAGRANELLTGSRGGKSPVHPNDHVNKGQSSNDVIPTAIHIASLMEIKDPLLPAMGTLRKTLQDKSDEFKDVTKIARTHLQDALPVRLGQIFTGYAAQVEMGIERINSVEDRLRELALGGTAVGTGVNAHPDFAGRVIEAISQEIGYNLREARNHFEAQAARDAAVETSGVLKTFAVSIIKIANDIRWLASGPRCGLGEITLPDLQPGSSIMPGKINPVIPEAVIQAAGQVIGNDCAITFGGQAGNFELNVTMPLIAYNLLQSIRLLASSCTALGDKCISGIIVNKEKCASDVEKSLSLATALVPQIGYDRAAEIAKEAHRKGKTIRETAKESKLLSKKEIEDILKKSDGY